MQMMKNFGETLKELKDIGGIKSITLASYLGYDISYISKWCANKKLPSGRNIIHILDEMSRIFSREIIRNGKMEEFNKNYKQNIKSSEELNDYIRTMLEDSYDRSKINEKSLRKDEHKVIFGKNEIIAFIEDKINEMSRNEDNELEVYITLDILNMDIEHIVMMFNELNLSNINIKAGCDINKLDKGNFEKLHDLNNILNVFEKCNVQIYDNIKFNKSNIFLVKNEFAIIFSLNEKEEVDFGVILTDSKTIDKIYAELKNRFHYSEVLIDVLDVLDEVKITDNNYIFNFYNSDNFEFLFNNDFDYLKAEQIIQNFNIKNKDITPISREIANLQEIIEKKFHYSSVKIFIIKEMLDDYIYLTLVKSGAESIKDILYRIELLIKYMEQNDRIKVYMFDSRKFDHNTLKYEIGVYNTDNFLMFSSNMNTEKRKGTSYIIKNRKMLKYIKKSYLKLEKRECMEEITAERLKGFLKEYKRLV